MSTKISNALATNKQNRTSWLPLIVVVLVQVQTAFVVNALSVSMAGITKDLHTPATTVGTAITAGTFAMAAFILLGAKLGQRFGTRKVFQIALLIHALAMLGVAFSVNPAMLLISQATAGSLIAVIAPALTVFIADNFRGKQRAKAIGYLAAAIPAAGVLALLIAGSLASTVGWRYPFMLVAVLGFVNFFLSFKIRNIVANKTLKIDWGGASLAAVAVIFLSFGFSGLNSWGVVLATSAAPFSVLGVSPALLLILFGIIFGQLFFVWIRQRKASNKPYIFDLRVLATGSERAVTLCMAIMLFVGTAANFLIPLYLQIVQGRSSLQTSVAVIPYTLSIFLASTFIASFYTKFSPRVLARFGFLFVSLALVLLAFTVRGEWSQIFVVFGLITLGLGQGAIVALVFNTLLTASPKDLAGDVGAWRGLVHNLSGSVGIAVASVFAVAVLGGLISTQAQSHPELPPQLVSQVNLDNVNFVTNSQLKSVLSQTNATDSQVSAAVAINSDARLQSLKVSLLALAGVALLAVVPAGRMPNKLLEEDEQDLSKK